MSAKENYQPKENNSIWQMLKNIAAIIGAVTVIHWIGIV